MACVRLAILLKKLQGDRAKAKPGGTGSDGKGIDGDGAGAEVRTWSAKATFKKLTGELGARHKESTAPVHSPCADQAGVQNCLPSTRGPIDLPVLLHQDQTKPDQEKWSPFAK